MTFTVIDVETANADLSSICQIGIARYDAAMGVVRRAGEARGEWARKRLPPASAKRPQEAAGAAVRWESIRIFAPQRRPSRRYLVRTKSGKID